MKALLADLERKHPTLRQTMLAAIGNVVPSHLYDRAPVNPAATAAPPLVPTVDPVADDEPAIAPRALLRRM